MAVTRFLQNTSANIVLMAGLLALPVCGICGVTLDLAHATSRQNSVQSTLDAAVLAATYAQQSGASDLQTKVAVHQFLIPQLDQIDGLSCNPPSVALQATNGAVQAEIACVQSTRLLRHVGHEGVIFEVRSASAPNAG